MDIEKLNEQLPEGTHLFEIKFSEEEEAEFKGWRKILEEEGQELWRIYHWVVDCQDGKTHGIYRLRDWLKSFNVPDNTNGEHWKIHDR